MSILYNGWIKIKEITHANRKFEKLETYDAVSALVTDLNNKILLVKQYRPCLDAYTYEIPAGCVDKLKTMKEILFEELEEEANIKKSSILCSRLIDSFNMMSGLTNAVMYVYKVCVNIKGVNQKINDIDVEEIIWVTFDELQEMILRNQITDAKTKIAYYKYSQDLIADILKKERKNLCM